MAPTLLPRLRRVSRSFLGGGGPLNDAPELVGDVFGQWLRPILGQDLAHLLARALTKASAPLGVPLCTVAPLRKIRIPVLAEVGHRMVGFDVMPLRAFLVIVA